MPYINVRLIGKLSREQKQKIASEFSETMLKVANKPKEVTQIVFDELEGQNWAVGDKLYG
ncbi:MAG: 4-oxalocrotonate tautomerase family protein [Candidatus Omnitrophica bacterium]|nr:4-oxalocrotonate tautomerase family protein [Candidatus Omnitrophota bacterium]